MKIIISHDVDHCKWTDHFKDLFIVKFYVKTVTYLLTGKISLQTTWKRFVLPFKNRQHRLPELCAFDREQEIPASYFVGMDNALGLMYGRSDAQKMIEYINSTGYETGVHGIAFRDPLKIRHEFELYQKLAGKPAKGMRMHYLRWQEDTPSMLIAAGYQFNSTQYKTADPSCMDDGRYYDFPVCMMDVYELGADEQDPGKALAGSMQKIRQAAEQGLQYYTIIFHDNYFDSAYPQFEYWYKNLVTSLKASGFEFTDFSGAIRELKNKAAVPG